MKIPLILKFSALVLWGVAIGAQTAKAASAVIEVDSATLPVLPSATPTTFTTINFNAQFASAPNVFVMTLEDGANPDPCTIRIRNVTSVGFEAVCHEPVNEDNASGGMVFDYIAIQNGTTTVPLASGTGNVDFVSGCVDISNQQYGPNCNNCSGAQGYSSVSFPASAFGSTPALLTQIQTTENLTAGEPVFIDVAVQQGSLSSSGFSVAIDQMEAGTGALSMTEQVCYLAAERNGCQELDFSGFEGPSSMFFQAVTGGNNIDGHGNGCSSGEGVSFAGGCFTSTPVAVAKQITRNGNNGGFIRRCSINSSEIVLTFDEDQVSDNERNHIDETASAFAFGGAFTTPVTLVQANITQRGRWVTFDWQTSAEVFHLGFDLWGEVDGEWLQLNKRFVAGTGRDTATTTAYRQSVRLSREEFNRISRFGISSIGTQGEEEFFGPFEAGVTYGGPSPIESVDWSATRAAYEQGLAAKGYVKTNNRWRRVSPSTQRRVEDRDLGVTRPVINMEIAQAGIQRVSGAELIAAAPELNRTKLNRLAIALNGKGIPRYIVSQDNRLDAHDEILFYAKAPDGEDAIYLNNYVYQARVDRALAIDATQFDAKITADQQLATQAPVARVLTAIRQHSATLNGSDPWFDQQVLAAGAAKSALYQFDFQEQINGSAPGMLTFALYGGLDFPNGGDDHHVQLLMNDRLIHDLTFDGFTEAKVSIPVPAGLLKQTGNTLEVRLPADTGLLADLVLIDKLVVHASGPLDNRSQTDFVADPNTDGYELRLDNAAQADVFAYSIEGGFSVVTPSRGKDGTIRFANLPAVAGKEVRFAVGPRSEWYRPATIERIDNQALHRDPADYLIVSHPNFIGAKLDEFVELKQQQGYQPRVVDWLQVVDTYGYGNTTPQALNNFLRYAMGEHQIENMLIVGGTTYDYLGAIEPDVVNFIPSHYRPVSVLKFSPTDNPYADLNGDAIPEFAIGRWPVRGEADLAVVVNKTLDWHTRRAEDHHQDAVLIAQAPDNRGLEFASQMQGRVAMPLARLPEFDQLTFIDMADTQNPDPENPIEAAQQQIRDAVANGADLISFSGHASPAAWGFQNIVDTEFVQSLNNEGSPLIVMPLACYTTNYESISVNTLAHQWLFAGEQGAVAIHGASVLGEYRENAVFAERVLNKYADSDTLGEAILKAKQDMGSGNSMLHNWGLLGEPTTPLR